MDEKKLRKSLKKAIQPVSGILTRMIEVADYEYNGIRDIGIVIEHTEFTSLCPRTGLPDFGTITIRYTPDKKIVELRSLKFYFLQYRNVGIFYEHVVNKILEDLIPLIEPLTMQITGAFNIRGGISTTVNAEYNGRKSGREVGSSPKPKGPDPRD